MKHKRTLFSVAALTLMASSPQIHAMNYKPYMKKLTALAKTENSKAPFAAMIINNTTGKVLCQGVNNSSKNPTLHGEIAAINSCSNKYGRNMDWKNTTLITTAEPCPMCMSAIIWADMPKVVYGTSIKTLSEHGWNQIDISAEEVADKQNFNKIKITGGVLSNSTDKLFYQGK